MVAFGKRPETGPLGNPGNAGMFVENEKEEFAVTFMEPSFFLAVTTKSS